jgi:L-asparaginase
VLKIAILATGGTIAGHSDNRLDYVDYEAGAFSIDDLITSIPEANDITHIEVEQLANFDSCEMTLFHWNMLKQRSEYYLLEKNFDGVVITHGTNTLEETAYFLHLTVNTEKAIVLVGSQRPFTALGTDAPINLLNAIRVAAHPDSKNKGVLVVLNNQINSSREVTKTNTYQLETFQSGQIGLLGFVDADHEVVYYRKPIRLHTTESIFSTQLLDTVPEVAIVYSYSGADGDLIDYIVSSQKYKGIVIAGAGAGMMSTKEKLALIVAVNNGLVVVRSSRVGNGRVVEKQMFKEPGFLYADNLAPQKSRILLMLSLGIGKEREEIQEIFHTY